MMRNLWSISVTLVLAASVPAQGMPPRDATPRAAERQIAPLDVARSVDTRPTGARSRGAAERATVQRVAPLGIDVPVNPPPGITPPGETPADGALLALEDAHRDYRGQLPVFPGAQGFGSTTPAGRGGRILQVTSLADSGPGTLRAAVNTPGPRIVIFEVGGVIDLETEIEVTEPYLTIAGQTAPSPGITVSEDRFRFNTHDVLVQHLRLRVGDEPGGDYTPLEQRDGLVASTYYDGDPDVYNIYFDHCSISWAPRRNVSMQYANVYDATLRHSIVSEALAYDKERIFSRGMVVGSGQRRISILRNLFAHNGDRNPRFQPDTTGLVVNNVIYNSGNGSIEMHGRGLGDGPSLLTVVGNVYLPGQDSLPQRRTVKATNGDHGTRLFVADNIGPYSSDDPWSAVDNRAGGHIKASTLPVSVVPLSILPAELVLDEVLAMAGARPRDRDAIDRRIVNDVRTGRGRLIRTPSDVDGFEQIEETPATRRRLLLPLLPHADLDADGYTEVEEWLHCMARRVEGRATALDLLFCPGP